MTADRPITRTTGFSAANSVVSSLCDDAVGAKSEKNL